MALTPRNARQMDKTITLMREVEQINPANGAVTRSLETVRTVWAGELQLSERDVDLAASLRSAEERKYRMRFAPDIQAGMLISDCGETYRITRLHPIGRRYWLDVYAKRET